MNGPHDLGGTMGFGPVMPEPELVIFHGDWEKRALGVTLAAGALGCWTLDESRHARESLPWPVYLGTDYYTIWIAALEKLLTRHGLLSEAELSTGRAGLATPHPKRLSPEKVAPALARGGPCDRPVATPARFASGQPVRARNIHPEGHTRLPRYVRGHCGVVEAVRGGFVFPDTNAHGAGEAPQWLYTVRFDGRTLWGEDAEPGLTVSIDAWESYLEPL